MTPPTAHWTAQLIVRELTGFANELNLCADDGVIWQTVPGVSNSLGTLAVHVCGNLRHFVGGVLGHSGYVRDRAAEFSRTAVPRAVLLQELADTAAIVVETLEQLPAEQVEQPFPQPVGGVTMPTGLFLTHLAAHTAFHLGQAGYLRRALAGGESRSAEPLPLAPLADLRLNR
jgi:uncharacterized damage-inducible protein DinB